MLLFFRHNGRKQQQERGFMVNQSLRSRLMFMAILPALMAALVVGGYSLVNRLVDVRDTNAQRQQLVTDSFAARLESTPSPTLLASNSFCASCWKPKTCVLPL